MNCDYYDTCFRIQFFGDTDRIRIRECVKKTGRGCGPFLLGGSSGLTVIIGLISEVYRSASL